MGKHHTHCAAVKNALDKAIAALIWDANYGCDSGEQRGYAQLAGLVEREGGVLEVDEERVEPGIFGHLHDGG